MRSCSEVGFFRPYSKCTYDCVKILVTKVARSSFTYEDTIASRDSLFKLTISTRRENNMFCQYSTRIVRNSTCYNCILHYGRSKPIHARQKRSNRGKPNCFLMQLSQCVTYKIIYFKCGITS